MSTHDALTFLPRSRVMEFPKGWTIYEPTRPSDNLHLVISGRVKIFCTAPDGTQLLLRIVPSEGFFGESGLVPAHLAGRESAVALESAQVMSWNTDDLHRHIEREPKLAMALFEYFATNNASLLERVKNVAGFKTGPRVMIALVRLSQQIGVRRPDGATRITGMTHQAIAEYVGTSREIVTSEMNRLRRLGYVNYSRKYLDVFAEALMEWQRQEGAAALKAPAAGQNLATA